MTGETMYTPKQAADKLGVSDQTIYRWIAAGLINATARGLTKKRYWIPASEVERVKREGNYAGHDYGLTVSA